MLGLREAVNKSVALIKPFRPRYLSVHVYFQKIIHNEDQNSFRRKEYFLALREAKNEGRASHRQFVYIELSTMSNTICPVEFVVSGFHPLYRMKCETL